jgi:hypothetical protein
MLYICFNDKKVSYIGTKAVQKLKRSRSELPHPPFFEIKFLDDSF